MARAMRRAHDHSVHGADRSIPTIGEPMKIRLEHSLYGLLAVGLASMPAAATSPNPQHATHHASHHDHTTGLVRTVRNATRRYLRVSRAEADRSEEHTSELQYLMRTSYAVFC